MPKHENLVKWCLEKAKKEIEKGQKHRGLVKVKVQQVVAEGHLKKAEHNLKALLLNREHGIHDWCISMGFYSMYHCCLAIAAKEGYESRNQECTLSLITMLAQNGTIEKEFMRFVEAMKADSNEEDQILALREKYQYSPEITIDTRIVEHLRKLCQDMIVETKGIVK